jgi:opacity protein-like surface antigen
MKRLATCLALGVILSVGAGRAQAEETDPHPVGVGYKIGNGLGFIGADLLLRLVPHVVFDLQANYLSLSETVYGGTTQTVTGYGLAPTVQFQLKPIGHTPYLGIGMVYAHESLNDVTASATGLLVNAGYEWRFASGVGVLVGGGIADVGEISATDGTTTLKQSGGVVFNLEVGVRYYF